MKLFTIQKCHSCSRRHIVWFWTTRHEAEQTKVRVKQAQDAAHARYIKTLLDMPCKAKDLTPTQREMYLNYINWERKNLGQPPL